ncbi:hypothetical protein K437DRAFT_276942 [Tilletiaria anomala UBC 951]|uniref:Velvet domain-containing protein n=1 Tax=Tilletiaria anomala (strain ATCC 24038 / CBS 436.72 / UBC 951) TaxID=1037660 RepID=A0A066VB28_TILAU|nr:uncharacterized protein K437DRAFT_276942 [Tilletiaria anomala UBC 951]KDN35785.1 hypothetical protein K437DRAFT_276942 [Tilletiaria anomala UBC 951]
MSRGERAQDDPRGDDSSTSRVEDPWTSGVVRAYSSSGSSMSDAPTLSRNPMTNAPLPGIASLLPQASQDEDTPGPSSASRQTTSTNIKYPHQHSMYFSSTSLGYGPSSVTPVASSSRAELEELSSLRPQTVGWGTASSTRYMAPHSMPQGFAPAMAQNEPLPGLQTPLMPPEGDPRTFHLIIRQQPVQGRMCGFGSKDRRPLDPVPIVQLCASGPYGRDEEAEAGPHLLMQVALLHQDPAYEATLVKNSSDAEFPWRRALEGKLVSSGHVVRDLDGQKACFFPFPDLSVRLEGRFRLRFTLVRLGPGFAGPAGGAVAVADSEPFQVYSPREFPGMLESTELAKTLARAGVLITTRSKGREQ